jgi:peptidoglycan/xylan/chitin deacetylase (PgdA/CDA1 family)
MKNIKLYYTFIIVFWIGLIVLSSIAFSNIFHPEKTINSILSEISNQSNILGDSIELNNGRYIILRIDDVQAWYLNKVSIQMIDTILKNNLAVSVGVIPDKIEKDSLILDYLKSKIDNPKFEIAQHGTFHYTNEFEDLNYNETLERIILGREEITDNLGITPVTFIPPYNEYNNDTLKALENLGFKIFSAKENEFKIDNLSLIGFNTRTKEVNATEINEINEVVNECNVSLNYRNSCVVMIHPSDFVVNGKFKYQEFLDLLSGLKKLNADFVTFNTFLEKYQSSVNYTK